MERFIRSNYVNTWPRTKMMDYLQSLIAANAVVDGLREEQRILEQARQSILLPSAPAGTAVPKKKHDYTCGFALFGIIPSFIMYNSPLFYKSYLI